MEPFVLVDFEVAYLTIRGITGLRVPSQDGLLCDLVRKMPTVGFNDNTESDSGLDFVMG